MKRISVVAIMLDTWACTEKPLNPRMKATIMICANNVFVSTCEIFWAPNVISNKPEINGKVKSTGKVNSLKISYRTWTMICVNCIRYNNFVKTEIRIIKQPTFMSDIVRATQWTCDL